MPAPFGTGPSVPGHEGRANHPVGHGARVSKFARDWIVQTKGRWAGKPMHVESSKCDFFNELFLVYDDGERVYHEALVGVACAERKFDDRFGAGSARAARALTSPVPRSTPPPRRVTRPGSCLTRPAPSSKRSPGLRDWLKPTRNVITCKANNGIFRVLSSDAPLQYGLNPYLVIIDELCGPLLTESLPTR